MGGLRKRVLFLALVMILGIISVNIPIDYAEASSIVGEEMDIRVAPPTDDLEKVWHIEFNKGIREEDLDNLYSDFIFVEGPLGEIHETTLSLSEGNNKVVFVTPKESYKNYEPYTLYILKGLGNAEDDKVINKTVKMDFTIKKQENMTIDTRKSENGRIALENKIIYGDLIIDGGGEVALTNVEVKGKIIVNDVGENSLKLNNVKATKLELNDTNGARIFVSQPKRSENGEESSILNAIDINEASSNPIMLEGDFSATKVNVNKPVELKITKETNIAEVNMGTTEAKIISDDNMDISASVGSITGEVSEELKEIQAQAEENKKMIEELINVLNQIPKDEREDYDEYLNRGRAAKYVIEKLLGDKVGEDYKKYPEYAQIMTANTLRSFMNNRKFTTLNQVEAAFIDAKEWNKVFGEGLKYAAYHAQREANREYVWPVISKDIEVGADITDIVLKLADGITTEQLNEDITVTILYEDEWNNIKYLNIDTENQKIYLSRLNMIGRQINISIMFSIVDTVSGRESKTNFIVTLEPQVSNIGEIHLTSNNKEIVSWIENTDRWIETFDNVTIGEFLGALKSSNSDDKLNVIDSNDNIITDMSTMINGYMQLEVKRGDDWAYYSIGARPVIDTKDASVIKEVINNYRVVVYPGNTVRQIIDAVKTKYDGYKLIVIDKNKNEVNENTTVEEGMRLIVNGYGFEIVIYIGEVNLISNNEEIAYIDNRYGWVDTNDTITVGQLLSSIESTTEGDILNVVDSNNIVVNNANTVNGSMRLEISRGENKAYYRIGARPIIKSNDTNVIKEVLLNRWTLIVHPGKTIKEVMAAIDTNHDYYELNMWYKDGDIITDLSKSVENGMELVIETGNNGYGFEIVIYIGEVNLYIKEKGTVPYINNQDRWVETRDNVTVGELLNAIESNETGDNLRVVDRNNIEIDKSDILNSTMRVEINRGDNKAYYRINAIPIIDTLDETIIKEVISTWTLVVQQDKTVAQVINAVKKNHDYYNLFFVDRYGNKVNETATVKEDMKLVIDAVDDRYRFDILIYIGEVNLISNDESIAFIDNSNSWIETYDNVTVGKLLEVVESITEGDILNVVDSNYSIVDDANIVNGSMRLEIIRGENKAYYRIGARPIIDTKDFSVIKEVINNYKVIVYQNKTVREILDSVETRYEHYQLSIRDSNKKVLDDNEIVENNMELLVDTGNGRYGFKISILESADNI